MTPTSRLMLATLLGTSLASTARAQTAAPALIDRCTASTCVARLTAPQLLAEAEKLVAAGRYREAKPMLAALANVPALKLETRFLTGFVTAKSGDHRGAASIYKSILAEDPRQTRVRLELAREMLAMGKKQSADRQFRIALQDRDLPIDVARTIRSVRTVIRSQRAWHLDFDFGFVPDTNINSATGNETVDSVFGPLALDHDARAKSGIGETASISAGARLPIAKKVSMLVDLDAAGTNYAGTAYDDYQAQLAVGPELRVSDKLSFSAQALGAERWYGGHPVSGQVGSKLGGQVTLDDRDRIGVQVDIRHTKAWFDDSYSGWQGSTYLTFERAVTKNLVLSTGLFAHRDWLAADAYSNKEFGVIAGFGGELPHGINFGLSGSVSRAKFDAPMWIFSADPRKDWRYNLRATLGDRHIRVLGFSPQVSISYSRIDSSIDYYSSKRTRFRFALARYF